MSNISGPEVPRGSSEPGYGLLVPIADPLAARLAIAAAGVSHSFGPDLYHGNLDVVPAAKLAADARINFVILKVSQGISYPWATTWFPRNAALVRGTRLALGGYHMLSGTSGSGAEQAAYFLLKYQPQP